MFVIIDSKYTYTLKTSLRIPSVFIVIRQYLHYLGKLVVVIKKEGNNRSGPFIYNIYIYYIMYCSVLYALLDHVEYSFI